MTLAVITSEPQGAFIVEVLEAALEEARAGNLSSVAIAIVDRAGVASNSWSEVPSLSALIGSTARLLYKLNVEADG